MRVLVLLTWCMLLCDQVFATQDYKLEFIDPPRQINILQYSELVLNWTVLTNETNLASCYWSKDGNGMFGYRYENDPPGRYTIVGERDKTNYDWIMLSSEPCKGGIKRYNTTQFFTAVYELQITDKNSKFYQSEKYTVTVYNDADIQYEVEIGGVIMKLSLRGGNITLPSTETSSRQQTMRVTLSDQFPSSNVSIEYNKHLSKCSQSSECYKAVTLATNSKNHSVFIYIDTLVVNRTNVIVKKDLIFTPSKSDSKFEIQIGETNNTLNLREGNVTLPTVCSNDTNVPVTVSLGEAFAKSNIKIQRSEGASVEGTTQTECYLSPKCSTLFPIQQHTDMQDIMMDVIIKTPTMDNGTVVVRCNMVHELPETGMHKACIALAVIVPISITMITAIIILILYVLYTKGLILQRHRDHGEYTEVNTGETNETSFSQGAPTATQGSAADQVDNGEHTGADEVDNGNQLQTLQHDKETLATQIETLQHDKETQATQIQTLQGDNANKTRRNRELDRDNDNQRKRIHELETEFSKLAANPANIAKELQKAQQKYEWLLIERGRLQKTEQIEKERQKEKMLQN